MKLATCVACVAFLAAETQAFVGNPQSQPRSSRHHQLHHGIGVARQAPSTFLSRLRRSPFSPLYQSTQDNADTVSESLEDEVRSMRVKEIKAELETLNVSTADAFEKEELVKRLVQARIKNGVSSGGNPSSNASTSPKEDPIISTPQSTSAATNTEGSSSSATDKVSSDNVIVAPLYFTTVDAGRVAAGVTIQSSDRPYATIQVDVSQSQSSQSSTKFPLNLLLDTACSGFVLRPSVVEKYKLPQLSTPVTMTGAGGSVGATGLTQVESFSVSTTTPASPTDTNVNDFGPMPAAVQDITGLPTALDGIIGLSFLNQFACVDMDFAKGTVSLYKRGTTPPADDASSKIVGQANMEYISSLGLYTVGVYLGDKGPVKMLVDSGKFSFAREICYHFACCSFSNDSFCSSTYRSL
ncbi:MAG: hypothetical protein SGILL_002009 [Bacillariaceae sp.]